MCANSCRSLAPDPLPMGVQAQLWRRSAEGTRDLDSNLVHELRSISHNCERADVVLLAARQRG